MRAEGIAGRQAVTDSSGVFYLELPMAGTYRLEFDTRPSRLSVGSVVVRADEFIQRDFVLGVPPDPVYFEFQVNKQVAPRPGNPAPRYPVELRSAGVMGEVLVQFVVDKEGKPERETIKILRSSDPLFTSSVVAVILGSSFYAAEKDGQRVRQLVQQPFNFCLTGVPATVAACR